MSTLYLESGQLASSCRRLALLSFTNAAIREFKTATINVGRRDLLSDPNYVGTFDAFVERYILGPFGHLLTGVQTSDQGYSRALVPGDWNNAQLKVWIGRQRRPQDPRTSLGDHPLSGMIWWFASNHRLGLGISPIADAISSHLHATGSWVTTLMLSGYSGRASSSIARPHIAELLAKSGSLRSSLMKLRTQTLGS